MNKVIGSPLIHESFVIGFTKDKTINDLVLDLGVLRKSGINIISQDLVFGHITIGLTNPAHDFDNYSTERSNIINELQKLIEKYGV